MVDFTSDIHEYFEVLEATRCKLDIGALNAALNAVLQARDRDANIYVFGNGGSASTASHYVCDFAKGASEALGGKRFHFHCLSDNTPIITAVANDIGYEEIFRFQLQKRLKADDLVIAISGSGNSENVVRAVDYACQVGTQVVGITGYNGGQVLQMCDYAMHVPIDDMQVVEDFHMIFDHMMLRVLSNCLKADGAAQAQAGN